MSIIAALNHVTRYRYDEPVTLGPHVVRLRPAPHTRTRIPSYSMKVTPAAHFINWQQDPHGNWLARIVFPEPTTEFSIVVDLTAKMVVINPFDFFVEPYATTLPFSYPEQLAQDLSPYLAVDDDGPRLEAMFDGLDLDGKGTVDFVVGVNAQIARAVEYTVRMEAGVQTPDETLALALGSCRDSAWLLVQLLRRMGLAARFVSGYLIQLKADIDPVSGAQGTRTDFTDLHAWAEVYIPGAGWIGFDATSGLLCGEGHIPLAASPHYRSAAAITGGASRPADDFEFSMTVSRLVEPIRITRPFEDVDWDALDAVGEQVEAELQKQDVRLTMGGEPTFVSIDDFEADEWNIDASGPTKPIIAEALLHRLKDRFGTGGLLHYGQGKWYPGEPLPRWALGLYWRKDGLPIWPEVTLDPLRVEAGVTTADAEALITRLATRLGVDPAMVIPAREDALHFIKTEGDLPDNLDLDTAAIDEPLARARLRRAMQGGLSKTVGYVLPLRRSFGKSEGKGWLSEAWTFTREGLFVIPGDSPLGLRLPLDTLPALDDKDYPHIVPLDPYVERKTLPDFSTVEPAAAPKAAKHKHASRKPPAVRTAINVEARDGVLYVFMPPISRLEDYLELIAQLAAAAEGLPIRIEGYPPPADLRMGVLKVTPDPGVIEVNVQPAASWREAVDITNGVYDDARVTRLGADKFMIDGRHTGTGGGAHVVVGGVSPADSPFLRRPDVLKSLLIYWQRHPALSYLFAGMFVGPTSQAPRIDEARHDALYELEIALNMIPGPKAKRPAPWLVDRLLRNLLTDVSGNTHRTEICIDKLYSPDGPTGRLGLLEFRSFEMPPDARMSLSQQLLIRALIAWFWRKPQDGALVRWGTGLHDRFMLPHFVWEDFKEVLADLNNAGYAFDSQWYEAQRAFRFPVHGRVQYGPVSLELRHALEPWHVMGEEGSNSGTVRFVDSSVERLQVLVEGFNPERHVITCNGRALPMTATGNSMEAVAGVRYKAWKLRSGLHPTHDVDAPLTFDIIDRAHNRSIGGCVYHVVHPGGRNYETFPVNFYEAQARRKARFDENGHTPGIIKPPMLKSTPEFPLTLDLRRFRGR
ncbi:transglutaminase family protein [Polymorphobacter sp. PAMC 29334]|uniref:transglutaminase family protein n=1 Tax=Polymorphobacter sp. PAMC 29334 TaxID=2862331 RepID=UPI001C68274E|nr:transglutaminase family protein [Polymorphobacter sp. PAMC 29334]QYE36842.1 transglutaminase family protein [Polymorphobacter sp. PAMC 29334]